MPQDGRLYEFQQISVGYVILLNTPSQGNVQYNIRQQDLQRVFGQEFGLANVGSIPNGLIVQLGPQNQMVLQPPRLEFKCVSDQLLETLYNNARAITLGPFQGQSASAFGVNIEWDVTFRDIKREEVFRALRPDRVDSALNVDGIKLKRSIAIQHKDSTYSLERSSRDQDAVFVNVNNNYSNPNSPGWSTPDLMNAIRLGREELKTFLEIIYQCTQPNQ